MLTNASQHRSITIELIKVIFVEKGAGVDWIFLLFFLALDLVPDDILINKLEKPSWCMLNGLKSWLNDRVKIKIIIRIKLIKT